MTNFNLLTGCYLTVADLHSWMQEGGSKLGMWKHRNLWFQWPWTDAKRHHGILHKHVIKKTYLKVSVSISHVFCSFEKQIRPTHPQPWPFVATIRCRTFLLQLSRFIIFAFGRGSLNPALAYTLGDRLCVNPFVHLHVLLKCILDAFSSTKRFACEWSICQFVSRRSFWQLQISWSSFTTSAQPNPGRCDERDVPQASMWKKSACADSAANYCLHNGALLQHVK